MFWIGLSIALVAGVLSVGLARRAVRTKWPRFRNAHIDFILFALLVLGLGLSAWEHIKSKRALQRVQARQTGRHLSLGQRAALMSALKTAPPGTVDIESVLGDGESHAFAMEIDSALKDAGWTTHGVSQAVFAGLPAGLILIVHDKAAVPQHATVLQRALAAIGFEAPGQVNQQQPAQTVRLLVGHQL